jgi:PhnB protein
MPDDMRKPETPYRPDDRLMQGVIPYLVLDGRSGEAADFYVRAFAARDIGRMPMEDRPGHYMHVQVAVNGGALMMTDHMDPGGSGRQGTPLARGHLQLVVPDGQVWWDRAIAAGCTAVAPFERQSWGDDWGLLVDPFGIHWAVLTPGAAMWEQVQ